MSKKLIPALILTSLFVSCAKERSYDEVFKVAETHNLSDFPCGKDLKSAKEMLYVPMTMGTPRKVAQASPFYQGDTKVVKCAFTENGIEVLEIEQDDRFSDNSLNNSPVLTIPGEYKAYACTEDQYGDCTNTEKEENDLNWDQKDHFVPAFDDLKVKEVNMLDIANIEGDECVTPQATKMVNYELAADGVINIELEKTYKLNSSWKCIRSNYFNDDLSSSSFKVRFFYSMVAIDKIASKDYKPLEYPIQDHDVYGYFKTEQSKLNGDFDRQRNEITFLANRWDPKKTVLKYYLSKSFNKPMNAPILNATYRSMHVMNKNLKSAGAGFQLEFIQQTEADNISPGDLRYSSLVLIDDPLANGLLGYAPSVKNPATGEIVQSHINMYGGVLKSGTKWVYDNAVDVMIDQKTKNKVEFNTDIKISTNAFASSPVPASLRAQNLGVKSVDSESIVKAEGKLSKLSSFNNTAVVAHDHSDALARVSGEELQKKLEKRMQNSVNLRQRFDAVMSGEVSGVDALDTKILKDQVKAQGYALDHSNGPEFFPIAGTNKVVYPGLLRIKNILNAEGILKRWELLTESQKEEIKTVILVNRYVSTLVHEFGHSLGLRHNFAGSTDGDNFYSKSEAQILGLVDAPAYSSVMDYAFSEFNELGAFGKYDIAALGYAYSGSMKTKDGSLVKVNDKSTLKAFRSTHNAKVNTEFEKAAKEVGIPDDQIANAYEMLKEASTDERYEPKVRAVFASIVKIADQKIVDFKYCTDENAGLSSKCNRHDEGTTLVEIAKHKIERYKNSYKYRNFRNDRNNFSAHGEGDYVAARYNEFFYIRDLMEDYEFFAGIYGKETMANGCSADELAKYPGACKPINDRKEAIEAVADFFVEVLKTPDLLCAVANKDQPNTIVEYKKLSEVYDDIKYSMNGFNVKSCFNQNVKDKFAKDGLVVVGENGKFLNGYKDTNPIHKYVTDREVRGVWSDKVMAFRMLFQRRSRSSTTDNAHMALVDHPSIKAKVDNLLRHFVLGKKLENPIPFTMENGQMFRTPYVIGNDYVIEQLEDSQGFFKKYLDMPKQGSVNLIETILAQVKHIGVDYSDDNFMDAYRSTNYVTVDKVRGAVPADQIASGLLSITTGFATYIAGKENALAYFMAESMSKKPVYDKAGKDLVEKIIKQRTNPEAPSSLTDLEKIFFSIELGFQYALINLSGEGTKVSEEELISVFGEEVGKAMFKLYALALEDKGVRLKEVLVVRESILSTPAVDATEIEKEIFSDSLEVLNDYVTDAMSEEVFDFYKSQLRRLQHHQDISNI